jgi:polysaccharide export outer membrane protein
MEYYPMKFMRRWMSSLTPITLATTKLCLAIALFIGFSSLATAQQPPASGATNSVPTTGVSTTALQENASVAARSNDRYRIGPGDLLDIRVFNKPQFSREAVRVDACGIIRMPFIENDIQAAGRTESELSSEIKQLLREYLTRPQVDVFIKEYQSQHVAVIGAVRMPSRFQLQRRVRLLDLLSYANGPADSAGRSVQVVHTSASVACGTDEKDKEAEIASVDYYKLSDTLRGDEKANPYVKGGDIVSISEADQVYVVGNVMRPSALPLKDPITISRAIAMVGGTLPDSKRDKVRIVRQAPGSAAKTEIFVDLKAIDKHQAEDVELLANDIVEVQTNSGKRLLKSFIGAIIPNVAQLPVRVVP